MKTAIIETKSSRFETNLIKRGKLWKLALSKRTLRVLNWLPGGELTIRWRGYVVELSCLFYDADDLKSYLFLIAAARTMMKGGTPWTRFVAAEILLKNETGGEPIA